MSLPSAEYATRRNERLTARAECERVHLRIGNIKLLVIAAALALAWFSLIRGDASGYWLLIPVAAYLALALWHELTLRARARAERAAAFYERGLARIEDRWSGNGATGERFRDAKHVYADDLDLFGNGGLFQLLSSAQTPMGEQRLADWLLRAAPVGEIRERQSIVNELHESLDLRENTALLEAGLVGAVDPDALVAWAGAEPKLANPWLRIFVAMLALLQIALTILWIASGAHLPFFVVLAVNIGVYTRLRKSAENAVAGIGCNEEGLLIFSKILRQIEASQFTSEKLIRFQSELRRGPRCASRAISRLAHIVNWIDARDSLLMKVIELPLLYTVQVGLAADSWRKREGHRTRFCVDAVAEFEALLSLSAYAYEHPEDSFPEFMTSENGAHFEGKELGHPLISAARCVRNSVYLGSGMRVLLVSGSNMSGKSTLLRTVGVNFVLAMAGAPVRAESLKLSWTALGTRIRSTDSLQESRSNFYTEILRIREVVALAERETPLLFLFDELLEGTNSHDRQIGSQGLLQTLLDCGAIGLVTTHDLALTKIGMTLDGHIRNVHFEDQIVNGEMTFDYKLRDGIVPKSNALDLMRWIGLRV
ncbi:MAG TPA: mismatch repair protein [Candidatus Sulfotelmatobacter sp.]|nr:mismatch repair protein [Candidatus Sulfotelmatobacter sp.]